jgi:hypothetical protein
LRALLHRSKLAPATTFTSAENLMRRIAHQSAAAAVKNIVAKSDEGVLFSTIVATHAKRFQNWAMVGAKARWA